MSNSPLTYARGCVRDCGTPEARVFAVLLIFLILLILLILSGLLQNMLFLALPVNGVIYPYLWILRWGIMKITIYHIPLLAPIFVTRYVLPSFAINQPQKASNFPNLNHPSKQDFPTLRTPSCLSPGLLPGYDTSYDTTRN